MRMPAMAPITIPAIAPPERPEFEVLVGDGDAVAPSVCAAGAVPLVDALLAGELENDVGETVVLVAESCSRLKENAVAVGVAEEREEKVSFIFCVETLAMGFSGVPQQMLIWSAIDQPMSPILKRNLLSVCVHSSLSVKQQYSLPLLPHPSCPELGFPSVPIHVSLPRQHTSPGMQQ
jgi:hypothetical protein